MLLKQPSFCGFNGWPEGLRETLSGKPFLTLERLCAPFRRTG